MKVLSTRHPVALALLVGGAVAVLVPVSSAVAQDSLPVAAGLEVQSPASLLGRGAGVGVPVLYRCAFGDQDINIQVSVVQRAGSETNSGFGSRTVPCSGEPQSTTVTVVAESRVFKKGTAIASAEAFTCGFNFCGSINDSREIEVTR